MIHEVAVLTPDKVLLSYRVARIGSRVIAHVVDVAVVVGLIAFLARISTAFVVLGGGLGQALLNVLLTFIGFAYFIVFEGLWNGRTLGKLAVGIRVRMADGTPITFRAAAYRNLLRFADFLPFAYAAGLVMVFLNERAQRFGDLAAGTLVVADRLPVPTFQPSPHKAGVHPFEAHVGDLRGMTRADYDALKRLADRFPQLSPPIQQHLLQSTWEPFREAQQIPHLPNVHDVYLIEAVVMKYGRVHNLL